MVWTSLCDLDELREGEGKYVEIGGFRLAVFLLDGSVYAIDNECPHAGGDLASGFVEDGCVMCPWHHWAFRLENGQLRDSPGVTITTYKTRMIQPPGNHSPVVQAELPIY